MAPHRTLHARRRFLGFAATAAVAVPVARLITGRPARAGDRPRLDPASGRARELNYTHDAASVASDAREAGARCANCTHFRGGGEDDAWAPCNIFPEHRVSADGWCSSWFSAA